PSAMGLSAQPYQASRGVRPALCNTPRSSYALHLMERLTDLPSPGRRLSLSVLVPVYNERYLAAESLQRLTILGDDERLSRVEIIVVDDGSSDGTAEVLKAFADRQSASGAPARSGKISWIFIRHDHNRGKGKAIQ